MHQIQFRLGLRPDSAGGAYSARLVGFKGSTSKAMGGERREWREGSGPIYFFSADLHIGPRRGDGHWVNWVTAVAKSI